MSRYELLERIGVGGMAEVFRGRATAVGGFEKPVAIKKILPHLSQDDRFVRMLIAEAKLLAHLRQRNIVQVYDVGLGEDGAYFLVMEYVEGHDLGALYALMEKARARFPMDLALHIGSEVCEALEHAHRAVDGQGKPLTLVHRDVSPSNVLLSRSGEVKLTDFGIAKKADQVTGVQSIAGKFAYMSPEQATGKPIGPTSDIYSLAVILYELLLGRRLFSGAAEFEALRLVREARVPRPREVEASFSRELEGILLKALSADPRARYQKASEFGAALRDYRYSAATAGDPAREIAGLLKRYFRVEGQREPSSKVVRIETVAGFEGEPFVPGGKLRPAQDLFDDATRAAPLESEALAASDAANLSGPMGLGVAELPGEARGRGKPKTLPGFDTATDDAETRMIDTSRRKPPAGRDATPTIREINVAALLESPDSTPGVGALAPAPGVEDLLGASRRRAVITVLLVLVGLALAAFVIAGLLVSGDRSDKSGPGQTAPPASGDALDAPAIKPSVKKQR